MDRSKAIELNLNAKRLFENRDTKCSDKDSWAKIYVEAEMLIPQEWRQDFYDELTSENESYRQALEESVKYFGVRWS